MVRDDWNGFYDRILIAFVICLLHDNDFSMWCSLVVDVWQIMDDDDLCVIDVVQTKLSINRSTSYSFHTAQGSQFEQQSNRKHRNEETGILCWEYRRVAFAVLRHHWSWWFVCKDSKLTTTGMMFVVYDKVILCKRSSDMHSQQNMWLVDKSNEENELKRKCETAMKTKTSKLSQLRSTSKYIFPLSPCAVLWALVILKRLRILFWQ